MKLKTKQITQIELQDWDDLIEEVYGRPYSFQQQDGCKERGLEEITVPCEEYDFEDNNISELVNSEEMGVSFKAWLERDPNLDVFNDGFSNRLFWHRKFYPSISMIINDLYKRKLLETGTYSINIDW